MGTCSPKMCIKAGNLKKGAQNLKKARNWDFKGQN